jgi:hypothetical protein
VRKSAPPVVSAISFEQDFIHRGFHGLKLRIGDMEFQHGGEISFDGELVCTGLDSDKSQRYIPCCSLTARAGLVAPNFPP